MPYSTLSDIQKILSDATIAQLTDDANGSTIDTTKVDRAIQDADELINGYLRGRYTLPLSTTPNLVIELSVNIAIYNLYSRRPQTEIPPTIENRYRDSLRFLEQIQKGIITLGDATGITPEPGRFATNKTEEDRIFTKELLEQMP